MIKMLLFFKVENIKQQLFIIKKNLFFNLVAVLDLSFFIDVFKFQFYFQIF